MSFIYDLHVHSSECSRCASSTAREMVRAYKESGVFSGFVLTNHYGRNPIDGHPNDYWNAYLEAKDEGEKLGFTVLFGLEYCYGGAQEILIYGIDPEFFSLNPDICDISPEETARRVRDYGGFTAHAHPFRRRHYIPDKIVHMDMTALDGIETYNAANGKSDDAEAELLCKKTGLIPIAGSDRHSVAEFEFNPSAGMEFDFEIKTSSDLVAALKKGEGRVWYMNDTNRK